MATLQLALSKNRDVCVQVLRTLIASETAWIAKSEQPHQSAFRNIGRWQRMLDEIECPHASTSQCHADPRNCPMSNRLRDTLRNSAARAAAVEFSLIVSSGETTKKTASSIAILNDT